MIRIDSPYHFDNRGHTAEASLADHIRDMIEEILFTSPGERVNRPDFGCGIPQLIFAPNSDALAAATQLEVHGSLHDRLEELLEIEDKNVPNDDSSLIILVQHTH